MMTDGCRGRLVCFCAAVTIFIGCDASQGVSPSSPPSITSLQPAAGPVGTRLTITGTRFGDSANTINFSTSAYPNVAGQNGTSIVFVVPMTTNPPCRNTSPPCAVPSALLTPGVYDVSVTNAQGTSNAIAFTVTAS